MYIIRPAVEPRRHLVLVLWSPPSTEGIWREIDKKTKQNHYY